MAHIIDARAAALNQTPRFAIGTGKARQHKGFQKSDTGIELSRTARHAGQIGAFAAALESFAGRGFGFLRRLAAMAHGGFGRQHFFGIVKLGTFQCRKAGNFGFRQFGKQPQKPGNVAIFRVAPKLPIIIDRQHIGVQPDRTLRGFAHFRARRCRQQICRQTKQRRLIGAPRQFDAVDNIAPLVGAAHLQHAIVAPVQFQKIIGLQNHVIEFEETQRLPRSRRSFTPSKLNMRLIEKCRP